MLPDGRRRGRRRSFGPGVSLFLDVGDCGGCAVDWVAVYGVLPAFTHKRASVRLDVPDQIGSFHHLRRTQDQLFACHFRTGSKSLLEMFTIGFKD